jgi:hypothetical protein
MSSEKKHRNLDDIPKKDIFKAPEGYFDSLQNRINERVSGHRPEGRIIGMPASRVKYISLAIAAAIALLIVFLPARQTDPASPSAAELISAISNEDALAFLKASDVEIDDLLGLSEPELWDEVIVDAVPDTTTDISNTDAETLYEQYGVSSDENMQLL